MIWTGFLDVRMDLMFSEMTLSLVFMMNLLVLHLMMGFMVK